MTQLSQEVAKQNGLTSLKGVIVGKVEPASPAEKAGMMEGDVLLRFDGKPIISVLQLKEQVEESEIGQSIPVGIVRGGKSLDITATLAAREDPNSNSGGNWLDKFRRKPAVKPDSARSGVLQIEVRPLDDETRSGLDLDSSAKGVVVTDVHRGGAGAFLGVQEGDLVYMVNGIEISNPEEFTRALHSGRRADSMVTLDILRAGSLLKLSGTF